MEADDILDPAHSDELVVAGIPKPEGKPDDKKDDKDDGLTVSEDGNVLEKAGVKYVRGEALHQARQEAKQLRDTLARLDPVMPEFEAFLEQRNNRGRATTARAAGGGDFGEYNEDELTGLAITRGYYKDDNTTPDLARAKQELDILTRVSDRVAQRHVKPLADTTTRERASINREKARAARFVDGKPIADQKYVEAALGALPDDYAADPNIANITQVIAAGLEYLDMRKNGTIGRGNPRRGGGDREPMFVERGTGRFDGDEGGLTDLDLAAARARGKTPEQWAKLSGKINKSNPSRGRGSDILEDI